MFYGFEHQIIYGQIKIAQREVGGAAETLPGCGSKQRAGDFNGNRLIHNGKAKINEAVSPLVYLELKNRQRVMAKAAGKTKGESKRESV